MIAILILAAGASSRMGGGDKMREDVFGQPCLTRAVTQAQATQAEVFVVIPALDHPRAALAGQARLIVAQEAARGMAHSLKAGIAALPEHTHAAIVLPGDMPEITTADLHALIARFDPAEPHILQATTSDGQPGHPILFPRQLFGEFATLQGDQGARAILKVNRAIWRPVALPDNRARVDLDTPEEWRAWRSGNFKPTP